ncbi:hypothetical protein L6452_14325 [Arctium lappa]|uniref:Uncharacterized protein n=1 Tax=Arctium lappa TaxID=4217 RepID=A0ACB9CKN8_ARCLA|nr:hypothetical protein L6452_14325 [Arctium lappa]
MVLPDFMYYINMSDDLSYLKGQCDGEQRESGFPAWGTVSWVLIPICIVDRHWLLGHFDMDSMVMTIYDSLKLPTLQQPLIDMMDKFNRKMPQLFIDLGEGPRTATRIFQSNITDESCRTAIADLVHLRNGVPRAPPQWRT